MSVKCQGCGNLMYDDEKMCPFCRLPNPEYKEPETEPKNHIPSTIIELKQWYVDRGLPPEQTTRFFIGRDVKEARAFGIYKDEVTGEIIVYKNKSDGSRAIRYKGRDEAFAVGELLAKLKEEIMNQKGIRNSGHSHKRAKMSIIGVIMFIMGIYALMIAIFFIAFSKFPTRGYYRYDNKYYYSQNSNWYMYDDYYGGWSSTYAPSGLTDNLSEYSIDEFPYYNNRFETSPYYEEPSYSSSSSSWDDDDYDWDSSDSWDSGSTDWDSDW